MYYHLDTLVTYLDPFLSKTEPKGLSLVSPTHLQQLLDGLILVLVHHLRHELETLTVEKLEPYLTKKDLLEIDEMTMKRIQSYPAEETLPGD